MPSRLRIPARLRAVLLGGAAVACSSGHGGPTADGGLRLDASLRDANADASAPSDVHDAALASVDGGPCRIKVPKGDVCRTTCYSVATSPPSPYACQVYCSLPSEGGVGHCSCNGGFEPEGGIGLCPGGLDCDLESVPDCGTQAFC